MRRVPGRATSSGYAIAPDGVTIPYVRQGQGPPVMVVGSSIYYPRTFSGHLKEALELTFVNGRHFDPTYAPALTEVANLSLESFADDIEAVRAQTGVQRWTVVGHSMHAQVALAYALKYPQHVNGLVMIAGVPFSFEELAPRVSQFWETYARPQRKDVHERNRAAIASVLDHAAPSEYPILDYIGDGAIFWADPAYDCRWLWAGVSTGPAFEHLAELMPDRADMQSRLDRLQTRILVVLGELDFCIPHGAWSTLAMDSQTSRRLLYRGVGHTPQLEDSQRFDNDLLRWIAEEMSCGA